MEAGISGAMPFLKAASENTKLLPIKCFGRSLYRKAISAVFTKVCDLELHFGAKSSCPSDT